MAWETNQPPINYLKRRVIYYKKRRGSFRKYLDDENFIKRYGGKKKWAKTHAQAMEVIEKRIKEFEDAINILESNQVK